MESMSVLDACVTIICCLPNLLDECYHDGADSVGEEHGYVVKIDPVIMNPPLMIQPGTVVDLISEYDASTDHFGEKQLYLK